MISRAALRACWEEHPEAKSSLEAWYHAVTREAWRNPHDIKQLWATASILKNGRVVFNVGGNKYRVIVGIHFGAQLVFVKFVGTHAAYDRVDASIVELHSRKREN